MATTSGEPASDLTEGETRFLNEVAHPQLDLAIDENILKHAADVWWNLCLWEKQRADVIDAKSTALLGLSSIASAVVASGNLSGDGIALLGRVASATLFLIAAGLAVCALFVRDHSGFYDEEVFEALNAGAKPVGVSKAFTDKDPLRSYLRETIMQRWVVYRNFKIASAARARYVKYAQLAAVLAILTLCVALAKTL